MSHSLALAATWNSKASTRSPDRVETQIGSTAEAVGAALCRDESRSDSGIKPLLQRSCERQRVGSSHHSQLRRRKPQFGRASPLNHHASSPAAPSVATQAAFQSRLETRARTRPRAACAHQVAAASSTEERRDPLPRANLRHLRPKSHPGRADVAQIVPPQTTSLPRLPVPTHRHFQRRGSPPRPQGRA